MVIKTVVQRGQKVSFKDSLWTGWRRGGVELRKGTETTLMGAGRGGGGDMLTGGFCIGEGRGLLCPLLTDGH
jgi:hypothetical protein